MSTNLSTHATTLLAILMIGFIEYTAIIHGLDGKMLAASVAIIAGLGGFTAGSLFKDPTQ